MRRRVGGVPELVRSGENGWLVPAGSVDELAVALEAAILAPVEVLDRMGAQGRTRVLERHDLSTEVANASALFEGVIGDLNTSGRRQTREQPWPPGPCQLVRNRLQQRSQDVARTTTSGGWGNRSYLLRSCRSRSSLARRAQWR